MARTFESPSGAWLPVAGRRPGSPRYQSRGSWVPVAGRRPGTPQFVEAGTWRPVPGRPVGSSRYGLGRDKRGRFVRVDFGSEAHYEWSADRRLSYLADGSYRYRGRRVSAALAEKILAEGRTDLGDEAHYEWSTERSLASWADGSFTIAGRPATADEVTAIIEADLVDLGLEAHWLWYRRTPTIRYFGRDRYTLDGRPTTPGKAQWWMHQQMANSIVTRLPDWTVHDLEPVLVDVGTGEDEGFVDVEAGTDLMKFEDIVGSYGFDAEDRRGDNDEERDVPIDRPIEDGLEEAERAWKLVELWLAKQPIGQWVRERFGLLISWYAVAHKIVYDDEAVFGEAIVTRFAPVGREGFAELKWRAREMVEKSEDDVTFVAAGFRLRFRALQ